MSIFTQIYLILSLFIGLALILWGLKLFKFYIIISGIFLGAIIGAIISVISNAENISVILIFSLIFGLIAWPIHKFIVYLMTGLFSAIFGAIFIAVVGIGIDLIVSALLFFLIGFILAVKFYESIVIIIMSLYGANTIFNIMLFSQFEKITRYRNGFRNINRLFDSIINIYKDYFILYLITMLLFIGFSLYFQKKKALIKGETLKNRNEKILLRNITYLFVLLTFVGFIIILLFARERGIAIISIIINIPTYPFSLFAWPVLSIITTKFIIYINEHNEVNIIRENEKLSKYILITAFSIIAIPLIGAFVSGFISELSIKTQTLFGQRFQQTSMFWLNFKAQVNIFFIRLEPLEIFFKWLFIVGILPLLLNYYAVGNPNIFGVKVNITSGKNM